MTAAQQTICVGNFDGVHVGHAALVLEARRVAGSGRVVVMSLDPHPAELLRPGSAPARLTTFEQRREFLLDAGADEVVRLEPTRDLLDQTPEAFVRDVMSGRGVKAFVEGPDFRFGKGRAGDIRTLRELGARLKFDVVTVEPVEVAITDHSIVRASSTIARWLLAKGRVRDVAAVLGRPFELIGEVTRGERRGRALGYPTANLKTPQALPADGVYAGLAKLPDGRRFGAAISVGTKPMFDGVDRVAEAYLLDVEREGNAISGLAEYGWTIKVDFLGWVREQLKLASVEALVEQMDRDCERVGEIVERGAFEPWRVAREEGASACP